MGVTGLSIVGYFALNRMADGVERGVVVDVRPREELCYTLYSSIPTNQPTNQPTNPLLPTSLKRKRT